METTQLNVLVVGGAGYIGCVLVRTLLSRGHTVRVYDRCSHDPDGLADVRERVHLVVGDMLRIDDADVVGVEAVINVGGVSSARVAEADPARAIEMNVGGAVRLAEICKRVGARRYLLASSCSVFERVAADDTGDRLFDEESPVGPASVYARSKHEAELALGALAGPEFHPVALRLGGVYGFAPRMRFDTLVNKLVRDALVYKRMVVHARGEEWRPVVAVGDTAEACAACIEAKESVISRQLFHVVAENLRVHEVATRIQKTLAALGIDTEVRVRNAGRSLSGYRVSGAKLERILGCSLRVRIEDAVREMCEQVRQGRLTDDWTSGVL